MCYKAPGPRCSAHAYEEMEKARVKLAVAAPEQKHAAKESYRKTQRDYYATPAGLKYLIHEAEEAKSKGQRSRAAKYTKAHSLYQQQRLAKIAEMRAAGYEFTADPNEDEVERCSNCGRFANRSHTCPGTNVPMDANSVETQGRVDIHRPASEDFDPQKYESVAIVDTKQVDASGALVISEQVKALESDGYVLGNGSRNNCGHCGTRIRYAAVLKRSDAKEYIYVGEQCLDNRFSDDMTAHKFQKLRKEARLNSERIARKKNIEKMVDENPHLAWLTYPEALTSNFTRSVAYNMKKYGKLSERQISATKDALERDTQRQEQEAAFEKQKEKEAAKAAPIPSAKDVTFQGEVLTVRTQPGFSYNSPPVTKMLVRSTGGWKVWITAPKAIADDVKKGDAVHLTADISPSPDDNKFGFGKRPRRALILDEETRDAIVNDYKEQVNS